MLADDQDPDGLAARVAFHLHRLNATGTALTRGPGRLPQNVALELAQGRLDITAYDIRALSRTLGLPEEELSRGLEPRERAEWHFYRISARNRLEVWHRARHLWRSHHMTQRAAATVMHYHPSHISHALHDHHKQSRKVLALPPAERLTAHLNAQDAITYFLMGLPDATNSR